ncbi:MAG TPA: cyclodeaminase/cyclohydrolase family protein [Defluviitoga sp.]|nr:cyclodeaminase/cyclohydrolase family protein [Defluviitoga sp.]HOP24605.1 cyclodeaminase/cyclohydrolase family protein [Defluviitoga sp.]HPZ29413.1 cyclodeaminase/cyclohydrolase family protein [Defluviitoga sp.]HQD63324.1 cyclodeaminase/cyclohydrolase family protein [Defluviitoga sp.]
MYREMVFEDILKEISSSNMSVDGGTVAALVGALAASLGSKIANYTVTSGVSENYEVTLESVLENLLEIKEKLLDYSDKSFHYIAKFHSDEEEGEKKIQEIKRAAIVSFNIAKLNYNILKNCFTLHKFGDPALRPETKITCYLAWAALNSAITLVHANLEQIENGEEKANLLQDTIEFSNEANALIKKLKEEVHI